MFAYILMVDAAQVIIEQALAQGPTGDSHQIDTKQFEGS